MSTNLRDPEGHMSAVMAKQRPEPEAHAPASASLSPRQGLSSPALRPLLTALISSSTQPTTSNRQNHKSSEFPSFPPPLAKRPEHEGGHGRGPGRGPPVAALQSAQQSCDTARPQRLGASQGGEATETDAAAHHLCQQSRAPPVEPWGPGSLGIRACPQSRQV